MLKVLQNPDFARLFISNFISEVGSQIYRVAIPVWAYTQTDSALTAAMVIAAQFFAKMVVGPLLSPLPDLYDRRQLMFWSEALSAVAVALLPLFFMESVAGWVLVALLLGVLQSIGDPAVNTVVPELVGEEDLDAANSLIELPRRSLEMIFMGIAGVLVGLLGAYAAFWIDAVSFALSALVLLSLRPLPAPGDGMGKSGYWGMVAGGLRYVLSNPVTRYVIGVLAPAAMFGAIDATVPPVLATQVFAGGDDKLGSMYYGFMEAFFATGAVLGLLAVTTVTKRFSRPLAFLGGLAVFGVAELLIGVFEFWWPVLVFQAVMGFANQIFIVPARSLIQLGVEPRFLGRVMAAWGAVMGGAALVGMMLGGFLAQFFGPQAAFIIGGGGVLAAALFGLVRGVPKV
ncbi:MFS transporter [Oceanithermus sp.]|uniref:MFS transporter n=1 Tax=Oceanithermus sp. TaxID=2268145 RepID=UPI00257E45B0|nr:MFS transporter [Oceanithermus sp.]